MSVKIYSGAVSKLDAVRHEALFHHVLVACIMTPERCKKFKPESYLVNAPQFSVTFSLC
jgi:hypothetical protein